MSIRQREERFLQENFSGVRHTTLNPEGPGVVRTHRVPPRTGGDGTAVVIPVGRAWSILLCAFIEEVNRYAGRPLSDGEVQDIIKATCRDVRKVYPLLGGGRIREDLRTIMLS